MGKEAKRPVRSVITAFRITQALKEMDGASVSGLTDRLQYSKGTIHNHLGTLIEAGYVLESNATYRLGVGFLEYGAHARRQTAVYDAARPEIDELASETGELAILFIEEHGYGSYLYHVRGEDAIGKRVDDGIRLPPHQTAPGKAIMAHLASDRVDDICERRGLTTATPNTITTRSGIEAEFRAIRERGVAFDREEFHTGLRCVAAPIFDDECQVVGSVGVAGPSNRMTASRFRERVPASVKRSAEATRDRLNMT